MRCRRGRTAGSRHHRLGTAPGSSGRTAVGASGACRLRCSAHPGLVGCVLRRHSRRQPQQPRKRVLIGGGELLWWLCCAGAEHGEVWAWGQGEFGQLGYGGTASKYTPYPVHSLKKRRVIQVAAGWGHSIALTGTGPSPATTLRLFVSYAHRIETHPVVADDGAVAGLAHRLG